MIIGTKTDFENLADFILRDYLGNDYDCYKPLDIQAFAENYLKLDIRQARELLDCLTEKQRQRYIKTMAYQKDNRTIAEEEGCSHQMISKSVSKAQEIIDEEKKKRGY